MRPVALLLLFGLPGLLNAQVPSFRQEVFHGRQAYVLDNSRIRVSALRGAGHIAEMRFLSSDPRLAVNPMRIPHFPTIEPWEYRPEIHDKIYGADASRILQSGYMGHLLNFPTFGTPSEAEVRQGLGTHGEALAVEWRQERAEAAPSGVSLTYGAELPKTRYRVRRTLEIPARETVLYVEESVENLLPFDRPMHWVQHVTFGDPFVEPGKTFLDMSAGQGEVRGAAPWVPLRAGPLTWPNGVAPDGTPVDLRPMVGKSGYGLYAAYLMEQSRPLSYFTMYNENYRVLIGYVWITNDFPWIGDWQENRRATQPPWNGKVIARGMEFGTTPFGGPMRQVVEEGRLYGVPVYRWIGGGERLSTRYLAFLAEIPPGFAGVADVRVDEGSIVVTERKTGRAFRVAASRASGLVRAR